MSSGPSPLPSSKSSKKFDVEAQKTIENEKAQLFDSSAEEYDDDNRDNKGLISLPQQSPSVAQYEEKQSKSVPKSFVFWVLVNTLSNIALVFINKAIFEDPSFRHIQTSFAAFHFACTSLTLYIASRYLGMFTPCRCGILEILPLSLAMCFNVILPNFALAYSTITFYQISRILLTPLVAFINLFVYRITIPLKAAVALIPVCVGVGIVSYFDTLPVAEKSTKVTTHQGVIFALTGVFASSLYTVWIGTYHKKLNMSSMQLLFNQAPVASGLLMFFIQPMDTFPEWSAVPVCRYFMILLSGLFASLLNLSQFFIVANAGATSSTVVGHVKTCSIVALGWLTSGRAVSDKSLLGVFTAVGGITVYSYIMTKSGRKG